MVATDSTCSLQPLEPPSFQQGPRCSAVAWACPLGPLGWTKLLPPLFPAVVTTHKTLSNEEKQPLELALQAPSEAVGEPLVSLGLALAFPNLVACRGDGRGSYASGGCCLPPTRCSHCHVGPDSLCSLLGTSFTMHLPCTPLLCKEKGALQAG